MFRKQKGSNTHTASGFPWFVSSTKPGAKDTQGFHTFSCSSQNELTAYNSTTKISTSTSIMFMCRFAPMEQTVSSVNVTMLSNSKHISNLISVDRCAGGVTLSNCVQEEEGRAVTLEKRRKIVIAHHHVAVRSVQAIC